MLVEIWNNILVLQIQETGKQQKHKCTNLCRILGLSGHYYQNLIEVVAVVAV